MPTISRFFAITMYYADHMRPHFHAEYAEHMASFAIDTLEVQEGSLPRRQTRLVRRWAAMHERELHENWKRARARRPLTAIPPLP
jgi:hypothetical protein